MMQRLLSLAALLVFGLSLAGDASAAASGNANVDTASQWCFGLVSGAGGAVIQPLVECFTDTNQGIIPLVTVGFLTGAKADYLPTFGVMFLLAIAWYGFKIFTGQVQRIKGETIILALKMAGIMLFLDNAPAFYIDLVNILQQLSEDVSQIATALHTTGFCANGVQYSGGSGPATSGASGWQSSLWTSWDCIFKYLLGFSSVGFAAGSIASFLMMIMFSMGTGVIIFFMGLYLILRLLTAAFRFIHVYLMSVLALSFVFCLGYLLVPLMLFEKTKTYFTKWVNLILSFILTPVLMFAFMGMMLVALDIAVFSGKYSVFCEIGGSGYCSSADSGGTMFKNLTGNVLPQGTDTVQSGGTGIGNPNVQDRFWQGGGMSMNGGPGITQTDVSGGGLGIVQVTVNTGLTGLQSMLETTGGFGGAVSGSTYNGEEHPEVAQAGIQTAQLNLGALASGTGSTCDTSQLGSSLGVSGFGGGSGISFYSNCPYVANILVSLCVASLIAYIMVSLLSYIPTMASNMTASASDDLTSKGLNFAKSKILGEGPLNSALGIGKEVSMAAAKGGGGEASLDAGLDAMTDSLDDDQ